MIPEALETIPEEWRPAERYIARCARCGMEVLKKNAISIYRMRRKEQMRILMYFCPKCYTNFLDDYGIGD